MLILNDLLSQDSEDEVTIRLDTIAVTDDILVEVEEMIFLQEALSLLTPQQQKVITATVLEERTEQEVATEFGMSQPAVHQIYFTFLLLLGKNKI
ncbi:MAG: sigma-70 family RNA polymerase sigma factor [Clostridia bacterium]|nr:sigma-70 family RNA polymerase sigma factor [Clostridia bacterium]